jgi:type IX secretion system PorP/SprF family membrane protein
MKKNQIILILSLVIIIAKSASGQQDAVNSQFIMNKMFINPGYTGYREQPTIVAVHRSQWIGFKGAPSTQVLSFDTPLKKNELAAGGGLMHDKLRPTSRLGLSGYFAYRTRLSNRATISWGATASVQLYQANLTDLALTSDFYGQNDEAFMYNTKGLLIPNLGFGAYYFKKDHFIGLSSPSLIRPKLEKRSNPVYEMLNGRYEPTIYLMGGKIFKVDKDLSIQGSALFRGTFNSPLSLGFYANALYMKNYNLGIFYHFKENLGLSFQWQIDKQLKVGYSFDIATSTLIKTNYGSHELAVNYALPTKKKRIVYPRYF